MNSLETEFDDDETTNPTGSAPTVMGDDAGAATAEELNKTSLIRAFRELQASNARVMRNAERVYDAERSRLILELLPVLDNVDRTLKAAAAASDRTLLTGLQIVRTQLESVLVGYGVERVDATGKRFDPAEHEAIAMVSVVDPQRRGMVVQQLEAGYRFAGKLLRAAKVNVGTA